MLGVEKNPMADSVLYKDASVQHQLYKTNEIAHAAHTLAVTNAKFLCKFNYGTDGNDRIVDMELSDDLLEFLYPALIEGHEKLVQKKQKREEEIFRKFNQNSVNQIKRVKYDKPWTIVWWKDGQITRSKCAENDVWSESAGFNACVAKRYFQTAGAYNKVLKTYCKCEGNCHGAGGDTPYEHGYQMGYKAGAFDTEIKEQDKAFADGRNLGYEEGYNVGYDNGYDDGCAAAETEAYNEGYDAGRAYERSLIVEEKDSKN